MKATAWKKGTGFYPSAPLCQHFQHTRATNPLQAGAARCERTLLCRKSTKPRVPVQSSEPVLRLNDPVTITVRETPQTKSNCPPTAAPLSRVPQRRIPTALHRLQGRRDSTTPLSKAPPSTASTSSLPTQTPAPELDEGCQHGGADRTKSLRPRAARHGLGLLPAAGSGLTYSVMRLASSVQAAVELAEKTR